PSGGRKPRCGNRQELDLRFLLPPQPHPRDPGLQPVRTPHGVSGHPRGGRSPGVPRAMGPRPYGREAAVDRLRRATAGLLCLASLSGCSGLLVDSYDYGTIEVEALSAEGDPVAGISLILYRNQEHLSYGVTNSQGRYTFASVPYGSVGIY